MIGADCLCANIMCHISSVITDRLTASLSFFLLLMKQCGRATVKNKIKIKEIKGLLLFSLIINIIYSQENIIHNSQRTNPGCLISEFVFSVGVFNWHSWHIMQQ